MKQMNSKNTNFVLISTAITYPPDVPVPKPSDLPDFPVPQPGDLPDFPIPQPGDLPDFPVPKPEQPMPTQPGPQQPAPPYNPTQARSRKDSADPQSRRAFNQKAKGSSIVR